MKKITFLLVGAFIYLGAFSQAVADNAVIPMAVTLNSILRLNLVSGGNIEFTLNNLDDYANGLSNNAGWDTQFTVISSQNWNASIFSEGDLVGTNNSGNSIPANAIAWTTDYTGTGWAVGTEINVNGTGNDNTDYLTLSSTAQEVVSNVTNNAGNATANAFTIHWEFGTANAGTSNFLGNTYPPDRYTTNVFLTIDLD